jgi:ornithine carbamoyltransferase
MAIATPPDYQFDGPFLEKLAREAPRANLIQTDDPVAAVRGAVAVYTDVWTSMGQEDEEAQRKRVFADYQVNDHLMAQADKDAVFLHCLPARRGQEVTDSVIDGPQSAVIQQASNRLHAQKGLLAWLLGAQA